MCTFLDLWKIVRNWFHDEIFCRMFVNAGRLLTANGIAAFLGLVVTLLTARFLGPDKYGILVLVLLYEKTISTLVAFNAWQAIIKYGSSAVQNKDNTSLQALVKFGFTLDITSALIGTILAITLSGFTISLLGWPQSVRSLLVLFSIYVLFRLNGTPIGILRLYDRFDLLSYTTLIIASFRLCGIGWCLFTNQSLIAFLFVYLLTDIIGQLYQIIAALWVLHQHGLGHFLLQSMRGLSKRFAGIFDYVWATNVHSTVRMLSNEVDGLIVAGLTTPSCLGLYKVAKQFSLVLPMLVDPLYQSIYPELSRLWSSKNKVAFKSLIKRSTFLVGILAVCGWLIFLIFGRWLIIHIAGVAYQDSYWVAVWYMFALLIAIVTFSFHPSMLAIGLPRKSLIILICSTVVYLILLIPFVKILGIVGASVSYIVFYVVWSAMMFYYIQRFIYHFSSSLDKNE